MDPRGFPTSLPDFQAVFPDDAACAKYLEAMRWPGGFTCAKCGMQGEPYRFPSRSSVVLRCRICKGSTSLTAGTVMQSTHTPLSVWFWGAYLVTTQTPGQSAVQFQRQLALSRYETAFQILHKLRAGMVRPERDRHRHRTPCRGGRMPRWRKDARRRPRRASPGNRCGSGRGSLAKEGRRSQRRGRTAARSQQARQEEHLCRALAASRHLGSQPPSARMFRAGQCCGRRDGAHGCLLRV